MKYLLRLQKFDMDLELLEKKLNCKILEKKKDRILVETNLKNLHSFNEIMEIVILKQNWKDFKTMKDFVSTRILSFFFSKILQFNFFSNSSRSISNFCNLKRYF